MRVLAFFLALSACQVDGRKCDGWHDCESPYERDLRIQGDAIIQRIKQIQDRTVLLQIKLEELDRCLTMKMTDAEDLFQLKVSIQTCVAVMRNVQGLTP